MSDYGEIFCEAVEEIVRNELRGLTFDLTRVCQVDNVDERDKGIYIVSTDSARFKAYSADTTYNVGDTVYVVTPNNDNTQQKIIIAKKVIETPQDITYVMPFNNMTDITKNLVNGSRENSLLANAANKIIPLWEYNNLQVGYTRLGIQGSFRSSIVDAIEGSYGLKIELYVKGRNEESKLVSTFYLDSDDMYGNPYNFDGYYIQQKVFDISSLPAFDQIKIYFYQDSDFKDSQGELIAHLDSFGHNLNPNLFVNDLYVCLGYDVDDIYNNGLVLYSKDGNLYDENGGRKRIEWRFIRTGKDRQVSLITEPSRLPSGYIIRLYKYNIDAMYNSIAGADWEEVLNDKGEPLDDFSIYTFSTVGTKESDKFKAIIIYNGRAIYESNILEFTNTADLVYAKLNKLQGTFQIRTKGDYDGIYHVYDSNNNIITAKTTQYLYPMFRDDDGVYTTINDIQKIKWTIPKNNTMINLAVAPDNILNITDESLGDDTSENAITKWIEEYIESQGLRFNYYAYGDYYYAYFIQPKNDEARVPFKLKETLNASYNNNTIICNIKHADLDLKATKELVFGYKSIEDYRAVLSFEDPSIDGFLLSDSQNRTKRKVVLKFYNPEGVEIPNSDYQIKSFWYKQDSNKFNILFDYTSSNNIFTLSFKQSYSSMPENYNVFCATVIYQGYEYTAYLPISISTDKKIEIEGASNIVYNNNGKPQNNTQKITTNISETTLDFVSSYDEEGNPDKCKPRFDKESNQLYPLAVAIENLNAVYAFKVKNKSGNIIKTQPIIAIVKSPVSKVKEAELNIGSIVTRAVSSKGYEIQEASFSAGKLEGDTQEYTGILMGKVREIAENGELEVGKYGLYGFNKGQMTVSIPQDGQSYIGGWKINYDSLSSEDESLVLKPSLDANGTAGIQIGGLFITQDTLIGDSAQIDGVNIGSSIAQLRQTDVTINKALETLDGDLDTLNKEFDEVDTLLKTNTSTPAIWQNITFISSITLAEDGKTINYQTTTMPVLTYGGSTINTGSFTINTAQPEEEQPQA